MPTFCSVFGFSNKRHKNLNLSILDFQILLMWMSSTKNSRENIEGLIRKKITKTYLKNNLLLFPTHFIRTKPVKLHEKQDPDWVSSLNFTNLTT